MQQPGRQRATAGSSTWKSAAAGLVWLRLSLTSRTAARTLAGQHLAIAVAKLVIAG